MVSREIIGSRPMASSHAWNSRLTGQSLGYAKLRVGRRNRGHTKHFKEYTVTLFLDHAAGDPSAGISGWVGFVVVRGCVNHDRSAAVVKERIRAVAERDARRM